MSGSGARRDYGRMKTPSMIRGKIMLGAGGKKMIVLTRDSLLSIPSRMKLLDCGRRPFTASEAPPSCPNRNVSALLLTPVAELEPVGIPRLAPGTSVANCVKLRPFKGSSVICRLSTTLPIAESCELITGDPASNTRVPRSQSSEFPLTRSRSSSQTRFYLICSSIHLETTRTDDR